MMGDSRSEPPVSDGTIGIISTIPKPPVRFFNAGTLKLMGVIALCCVFVPPLVWAVSHRLHNRGVSKVRRHHSRHGPRYVRTWYGWINADKKERRRQRLAALRQRMRPANWQSNSPDLSWMFWDPTGEGRRTFEAQRNAGFRQFLPFSFRSRCSIDVEARGIGISSDHLLQDYEESRPASQPLDYHVDGASSPGLEQLHLPPDIVDGSLSRLELSFTPSTDTVQCQPAVLSLRRFSRAWRAGSEETDRALHHQFLVELPSYARWQSAHHLPSGSGRTMSLPILSSGANYGKVEKAFISHKTQPTHSSRSGLGGHAAHNSAPDLLESHNADDLAAPNDTLQLNALPRYLDQSDIDELDAYEASDTLDQWLSFSGTASSGRSRVSSAEADGRPYSPDFPLNELLPKRRKLYNAAPDNPPIDGIAHYSTSSLSLENWCIIPDSAHLPDSNGLDGESGSYELELASSSAPAKVFAPAVPRRNPARAAMGGIRLVSNAEPYTSDGSHARGHEQLPDKTISSPSQALTGSQQAVAAVEGSTTGGQDDLNEEEEGGVELDAQAVSGAIITTVSIAEYDSSLEAERDEAARAQWGYEPEMSPREKARLRRHSL